MAAQPAAPADRVPEASYPAGEPVRVEERDGSFEFYYCDVRVRGLSAAGLRRDTML